jgi:hypothetical protein
VYHCIAASGLPIKLFSIDAPPVDGRDTIRSARNPRMASRTNWWTGEDALLPRKHPVRAVTNRSSIIRNFCRLYSNIAHR